MSNYEADEAADWQHAANDQYTGPERPDPSEYDDRPVRSEPAWIQEVRDDSAVAYRWVAEHMAEHVAAAAERFVITNPHMKGIPWWDAMDALRDADAHLDIIEPLAERMRWTPLHAYVTLTLIYAVKPFSTEWDEDMRYMVVRATIENDTRYLTAR
jgi:hypothetical protein